MRFSSQLSVDFRRGLMQQGDDFRHCLVKQGWAGAPLHVALGLLSCRSRSSGGRSSPSSPARPPVNFFFFFFCVSSSPSVLHLLLLFFHLLLLCFIQVSRGLFLSGVWSRSVSSLGDRPRD